MNSSTAPTALAMALIMGFAAPWACAGPVLDRIEQTGKIAVGNRDASVPFSYLDGDRKPVRYAIDLCIKVTEAVRKKLAPTALRVEFVTVTSAARMASVSEGQVDLECESTTNNAERRKSVAFAVPHYITGARFLVRAGSGIQELKDFEDKSLVSTVGTTPLRAMELANR